MATKRQIIDEFQKIIDEHKIYSEKLMKLVEEGKVNSGCLYVHSTYWTYPYKWLYGGINEKDFPCRLYGKGFNQSKKRQFEYHKNMMKQEVESIKDFISRPQNGWKGFDNVD